MAKKRRKVDKIRARERLAKNIQKRPIKEKSQLLIKPTEKMTEDRLINLFNYDPKFIKQDLKKTILVTLVVLVVLALIALRYT